MHYRLIAQQIAALVRRREARVLDYGSGEALMPISSPRRPPKSCSAKPPRACAPPLRRALPATRKSACVAPEEIARLPEHALDLIVLHSVAQYLTPAETDALFALFRRLLKPGGMFVVSDIIPPNVAAATDALALLRFAAANGFFSPHSGGSSARCFRGMAAALAPRPDPL